MRRHARLKHLTEIIGWCAAGAGIFMCMSIVHKNTLSVFSIIGFLLFIGWLFLRRARNDAALLKDEFYAEYPAARPSLKYMHPFPERRLVKLLPSVIYSLQDNKTPISYIPPQALVLPLWRGLLIGLLCFIWVAIAFVGIFYVMYKQGSFLPSDATRLAAGVFSFLMGILLLWRWRHYEGKGYIPPELRDTPRPLHGLSKVFMLSIAVAAAYFVAAHGVMRMLHHDEAAVQSLHQVRMVQPREYRHGRICMKLPAFSASRHLLCVDKRVYLTYLEYGSEAPRVRVATTVFGTTIEGLEVGDMYFENKYR